MKKWIAVMLVALMALSLIACGGKSDGVVGTWKLSDGTDEQSKQAVELMKAFGMEMKITFKEDGTGSMETSMGGETQAVAFTYTYENGTLTMTETESGSSIDARIDGNKLIMEQDGAGLIFKK